MEALLGKDRAAGFLDYMQQFAANFGVDIGQPARVSNTRRALALTEYARDHGKLESFRDATMEAYWLKGKDIESDEVLETLAIEVGLDPKESLAASTSPEFEKRIDEIRREAKQIKVNSIPTFILGDARVVGCQSYGAIQKLASESGLPRR